MSRRNPRFRRNNPQPAAFAGNIWQVSVLGQLENQLTVNNFYYGDPGTAPTNNTENNIVVAFGATVLSKLVLAVSNEWTLTQVRVAAINLPTRIPQYIVPTSNLSGLGGAGHLPTPVSGVVTRYTTLKGQSGRGRVYIPAVPLGFVTAPNESTMNAAGLAAYANLAAGINSSFTAGGVLFQPMLPSRRGVAAGGAITNGTLLQTVVARSLLGTIRRRRIGRGK